MPMVDDSQPLSARVDVSWKACQLLGETNQTCCGRRFGAHTRADRGRGSAVFDESARPEGWGTSKVMVVDLGQAAARNAGALSPTGEGVRFKGCRSMGFALPWSRC